MMDRMVDFPHRDVEACQWCRGRRLDWVTPETTLERAARLMARAHTRYPVIDDAGGYNRSAVVVILRMSLARLPASGGHGRNRCRGDCGPPR